MRYKVLRGVILGPGRSVNPGDVITLGVDVDQFFARTLIARGCITPVETAPAPSSEAGDAAEPLAGSESIESREPEPEHREPRRRRGKGD